MAGHHAAQMFERPVEMSPEEARAMTRAALADADRTVAARTTRPVGPESFCVRIYTCEVCGHVTPTVGFPLPAMTCYKRLRIPGEAVRTRKCGGKLRSRYGGRS